MPLPKIDWLSLTIKYRETVKEIPGLPELDFDLILFFLKMEDLKKCFVPMKGIHRYQTRYSYQGITVNEPFQERLIGDGTQENSGMGYNITMSGTGVQFFLEYQKGKDPDFSLREWLKKLDFHPVYELHCSRIDIAIDDITEKGSREEPLLKLDRIIEYTRKGQFNNRSKSIGVVQKDTYKVHKDKDTGFCKPEPAGKTLYFGSRKSEKYIRIYDKLAEQKLKNPDDSELEKMSHWVRFEVEYKGKTAQAILYMYMDRSTDFAESYCAHLRHLLYFADADGKVFPWWDKFCNDMEPVRIRIRRKRVDTGDFNRMRRTFFYQMGRNALTVMIGLGPDEFYNQLLGKMNKMEDRHWSIIEGYYHDQQLDKTGFVIPGQYAPLMEQTALKE